MNQIENLKIVHENIRKYFEEVTFTRQARITDKAFRFLTFYTFTIAIIPTYVSAILDFSQNVKVYADELIWVYVVAAISAASLGLFVWAVILMLRVVHVHYHQAFDFAAPLEEVWANEQLPEEVLLYSISQKLLEAANQNTPIDDERSKRMNVLIQCFMLQS